MTFNFSSNQKQHQKLPYEPIAIDDALSKEMVAELIRIAECRPASDAMVGAGNVDAYIRRSKTVWLNPNDTPEWLWKHFEMVFGRVNQEHFGFDLYGAESFQYTVYESGNSGEYKWHADTVMLPDGYVRKLSMSILLSNPDEYEGGRLILSPQGNPIVAEERAGRGYFFPSWIPHCVTPVSRGVRKSLVIWAHGAPFK
jgi:PKHD-type hydroxylase